MAKRTKMLQTRVLGTLTFRAGQSDTLLIPRGYSLASLLFRLTATLSRAAGASAGAGKDLTGAQLINRIEVRKNGREVVKALSMETLMRLNQQRVGTLPEWALSAVWTGYDVKSTTTFAMSAELMFEMWNALQPLDTLFDTTARNNISTLDLVIYWGQLDDVMTPAYNPSSGGVTADVTPSLLVTAKEYVDPDAVPGEYGENREYVITKAITATNPKEQIQLNVSNWYRGFTLKTHADGVQRSDIINTITLRSGSQVFALRNAEELRQYNKTRNALELAVAGYYTLDLCEDGHLSRCLPTVNLSELIMELDVTKQGTNCYVEVIPTEIVRQPVAAAAG